MRPGTTGTSCYSAPMPRSTTPSSPAATSSAGDTPLGVSLVLGEWLVVVVAGVGLVFLDDLHHPAASQPLRGIDARRERVLFRVRVADDVQGHRDRRRGERQVTQGARAAIGERVCRVGPHGQPDVIPAAQADGVLADAQGPGTFEHEESLLEGAMEVKWEGGLPGRDLEVRAAYGLSAGRRAESVPAKRELSL